MLSGVELSAAFNVGLSFLSAILGIWFIRRLWDDVLSNRDIGAIGFMMIFVTAFLFNLWEIVAYAILISHQGNPHPILPFTQIKPFIHTFEIFAYLLLYLHFKK